MSTSQAERPVDQDRDTPQIRKRTGWFAGLGVLMLILGIAAIAAAFWATLATVLFFGFVLLIAGIVQLIAAVTTSSQQGFGWQLLGGLAGIIVGGVIIFDPIGGAIGLTLLLAIFFLLEGILRMIAGTQMTVGGKDWLIASGVVDLLLGLLIAAQWPESAVWVIGVFLGIDLLFIGLAMLMVTVLRTQVDVSFEPNE